MSTDWTPEPARPDLAEGLLEGAPVERYLLHGPTMATRWSAVFYATSGRRTDRLGTALQAAVDRVDAQMSTWKSDSDLNRFNAAPVGATVELPPETAEVLAMAFAVGQDSGGAFDIGVGALVDAWGFGPAGEPDLARAGALTKVPRRPAHEAIILDGAACTATKVEPIALDLSGIAKGYGVDQLAEALDLAGVRSYLVSIDGELRARGRKPGGRPWTIAVERPDRHQRDIAATVGLQDAALATSGDYRHRRERDGRSWSHTIDPRTGSPVDNGLASVTVMAPTCMEADAWATALLVMGPERGRRFAESQGFEAIFMTRDGSA